MKIANRDLFKGYPDDAQVWIYQSNREMTADEMKEIETKMIQFTDGWTNHGNPMKGTMKVLNPYFLVSTVDPTVLNASGCSVDAFNNHLKDSTEKMNIDFFDRMILTIEEDGKMKQIPFSAIDQHHDALLYDPLVTRLKPLRENWPCPVSESNFASVLA